MIARTLGGSALTQSWTYYTWTETTSVKGMQVGQGARLKQAASSNQSDSLLNLSYTYDKDGNIVNILESTNSNQKQCFEYTDVKGSQ